MNAQLQALHAAWTARSVREQVMLGFAAILAAGIVIWYGIVTPLQALGDTAMGRHRVAAAELARVQNSASFFAHHKAGGFDTITQSAAKAHLTLARSRVDDPAQVTIWLDAAPPAAFFAWLQDLQDGSAIVTRALTATRNPDGTLRIEAQLARAGI